MKRIADKEIRKHVPLKVSDTERVEPSSGEGLSIVLVQHRDYTVRGICTRNTPVPGGLRAAIQIRGPQDSYFKAIATEGGTGRVVSVSDSLNTGWRPITQTPFTREPGTIDAVGWAWSAFDMIGFQVFGAINAPRPDRAYCIFGGSAVHNES